MNPLLDCRRWCSQYSAARGGYCFEQHFNNRQHRPGVARTAPTIDEACVQRCKSAGDAHFRSCMRGLRPDRDAERMKAYGVDFLRTGPGCVVQCTRN
jgi:hypothetical protein